MMNKGDVSKIVTVLLLGVLAGCGASADAPSEMVAAQNNAATPTATPFVGLPSMTTGLVQLDGEKLEGLIARIAAEQFLNGLPGLIVFADIEDPHNLYQGVSSRVRDAKRCWLVTESGMTECPAANITSGAILVQGVSAAFPLGVYFGIATQSEDEVLVIVDVHKFLDKSDTRDEYRVVLQQLAGKWRHKSTIALY